KRRPLRCGGRRCRLRRRRAALARRAVVAERARRAGAEPRPRAVRRTARLRPPRAGIRSRGRPSAPRAPPRRREGRRVTGREESRVERADGEAAGIRLSVQIVTWNSAEVIDACLASVAAQGRDDVEVVVVDNASADDTAERVAAHLAAGLRGTLIRSDENLGFCGGQNRAFASARGDWILFLNPDATLPPDFAARALAVAARLPADVGLVAPRILLR